MFEDVATKDWIGYGLSAVTGGLAAYAIYLTVRRERREAATALAAKEPLLDVELPSIDGPGPWVATYSATNRGNAAILLKRISLVGTADLVITIRGLPQIANTRDDDGSYLVITEALIDKVIQPGSALNGKFELSAVKRVSNRHPVRFLFDFVERSGDERTYRRTISRMANP